MDEMIQKAVSLTKQGTYLFRNKPSVQYGVLGGYLFFWLIFTGSLTETLLVACAMGLGWQAGRCQQDKTD